MVPALCSIVLLSVLPTFSTAAFPPPQLPTLPMEKYQVDNGNGDAACPSSVDMVALQQARQMTMANYSALKEARDFEEFSDQMRRLWDVEDENIKVIVPKAGIYTGIEDVIEYITLVVGSINGGFAYYYNSVITDFEYFPTNSSYAFQVAQKAQFDCTVLPSPTDPGKCNTGEMDALAAHHITWKPCTALISQYVIGYDEQQNYLAMKGMTLTSICSKHERFCTGENQQFTSFLDCMSFMESIPAVSCEDEVFNGDNAICRFKHSIMIPFRPDIHCPHIGRETYACTDEACGGKLACGGKPGELLYTGGILPNGCSKECSLNSTDRKSRRNAKSTKSLKGNKSTKSPGDVVNTSRCASSW